MEDLAAFLERLDYPYYVITVRAPDEEMSGCLATFVTQCSIDPPNFIACVSKRQPHLGRRRALHRHGPPPPRPATRTPWPASSARRRATWSTSSPTVDWRLGPTGAPLLADVAVSVEGNILGHFSVGDHEAFLLRAVRAVAGPERDSSPFAPGHPSTPGTRPRAGAPRPLSAEVPAHAPAAPSPTADSGAMVQRSHGGGPAVGAL